MRYKCSNTNPYSDIYSHFYAKCDSNIYSGTNSNIDANCDRNPNGVSYTDRNTDVNRHAYGESYANGYIYTGPNNAQRARLQSAGPTNSRPLLERSEFKQRRCLPEWCGDCQDAERRFLHRFHWWPWSRQLHV